MSERRVAVEVHRRRVLAGGAALLAGAASGAARSEVEWPARPVRLVVPFSPGGAVDTMARILAEKLRERLGQSVLVENVVGAGTMVATEQVARAAPDGYTFLLAASAHTINPAVQKVRYNPVADFTPVTLLVSPLHVLVVNNDVPARTVAELIALGKAKPGSLTYGSVGHGTSTHMEAELFAKMAGIELVHVPYRGSAPALQDLVTGRIPMMFDALASSKPHIEAKTIRALGVTSAQRSSLLPDLPTIAESGLPGYEAVPWTGCYGPANVPKSIVDRMNAEFQVLLGQEDIRKRFAELGLEILSYPPDRFASFAEADLGKWAQIARDAGIKPAN
ncbi:MAG: Tripartite tricarboxylate transporter family receptor [Enterovirga sp.]|jgi:tripartite-type tricarboxylate transporter receptor subunit TctC|nr:Tripartite tricarboxylate transporter family receptor [Enterovirga sp.]